MQSAIQDEAEVLHREIGISLGEAVDHIEAQRATLARMVAEFGARTLIDFEDPSEASEPYSFANLIEVNAKAGESTATLLEWAELLAALEIGDEVTLEWWPIRRVA